MKKFLRLLIVPVVVLLMSSVASAKYLAVSRDLYDSNNVLLSDYNLTSGVDVYSETLDVYDNGGFMSLLATEDFSLGNGDVDISIEYSVDGETFYSAYTSSAGLLTKDADIVTGLQNCTRWIVHTIRMGRYIRYKFSPDSDSKITIKQIYLRDM